jgi:hypothetical protein
MVEFNASRSFLELPDRVGAKPKPGHSPDRHQHGLHLDNKERASLIFEKLEFIDGVIDKYINNSRSTAIVPVVSSVNQQVKSTNSSSQLDANKGSSNSVKIHEGEVDIFSEEVNLLPRSLLGPLNRITKELDPEAEKEVVKNFRNSKVKTVISLRFILLLILVPLLANQLSKNFIVGPVVDYFRAKENAPVFLNINLEEEAFQELERFEQHLKFERLIGRAPSLSLEETEKKIAEKAVELAEEYRTESSGAIKNIFADLISCIAFAAIILTNKKVFKYWIFRYLNRSSPSAVATYKNMNE